MDQGFSGLKDNPTNALNDTLTNIENVDFSDVTSFDLVLNGDAKANILKGGSGNDIIDGGSGDDKIYAGAGNDKVYASLGSDYEDGGDGIDTFIIDEVLDYIPAIDLQKKAAYLYGTEPTEENVVNFENIQILSSSNFVLIGDDNANILKGGSGNDIINGGLGSDKISTGNGSDTVVIRQGDGGNIIAEADIISDFSNGSDLIGLHNLNYSDLTVEQGSGDYVNDALISSGSEYLVVIEDINIADLTEADFVAFEIV